MHVIIPDGFPDEARHGVYGAMSMWRIQTAGLIVFDYKSGDDDVRIFLNDDCPSAGYYQTRPFMVPTICVKTEHVGTQKFQDIVAHELGHSIGMVHDGSDHALMNVYAPIGCLTDEDLAALCGIYHCTGEETSC